jgi:hypothetical protein
MKSSFSFNVNLNGKAYPAINIELRNYQEHMHTCPEILYELNSLRPSKDAYTLNL